MDAFVTKYAGLWESSSGGATQTALRLWNLDTDKIETVAPGGVAGQFSPDTHFLAFVTTGPAKLDSSHRLENPGFGSNQPAYLQLMDWKTREVFLSVPVTTRGDENIPGYHRQRMFNFSPDGRYLAFTSPAKLNLDSSGWPVSATKNDADSLHVLDLVSRRLVFSEGNVATLPWWSPKGDQFVYNYGNRFFLFDSVKNSSQFLWDTGEISGVGVRWSYDGAYLSVDCDQLKLFKAR